MTRRAALLLATTTVALLCLAASAAAAPLLKIASVANTTLAPGAEIAYYLSIENAGDEATGGGLRIEVKMPAGLTAVGASKSNWKCAGLLADGSTGICTSATVQDPHGDFRSTFVTITARADLGASGLLTPRFDLYGGNAVRADGGACDAAPPGTPCASTLDPTQVAETPPGYGIDAFDAQAGSGPGGGLFTEAGAHPYDYTTFIDFNRLTNANPFLGDVWPAQAPKDILDELPPGFIGDPLTPGVARCTEAQLAQGVSLPFCPAASQLGTITIFNNHENIIDLPIFNMVPPPGVAARFGFNAAGTFVFLDASARSGGDYGITVASRNTSEGIALAGSWITFWGVPADPAHDPERDCPGEAPPAASGPSVAFPPGGDPANCPYERPPLQAFFRNPTSCAGPTTTTIRTDSWFDPGTLKEASAQSHEAPGYPAAPSAWGAPQGPTGCEQVPFEPSITFEPTSSVADSPTGLNVDLSMPQEGLTDPSSIAQADVKDAVVRLPAGMSVNPAAANGLGACTSAQIALHSAAQPSCPDDSKLGTVEIDTPLQEKPLFGSIYQAAQNDNPFDSTLAYYTVANGEGFTIKLAAEVRTNPETGRLENVFTDNPQLPFSHYKLSFDGGARAPLVNPQTCGTKTANATFTGWAGNAPVQLASSFQITSGPNGSPCVDSESALPFHPGFQAGLTSPIAASSSPFVLKLSRSDGEQLFSSLALSPPPGLLGDLRAIPYCPEAQIPSGDCPAASQVGTAWAGAGAGPSPLYVGGGRVYLAGPYKGAPLSLVLLTPAKAGPFDLGNVVVRTALRIDPASARLTALSDPIPQSVMGVALHLRDIYVAIDRPGFVVAPTSCDPMSVDATVAGAAGATANLSERFQLGECRRLAFKPKLSLRLQGKTNRGENPALRATLTMPRKGQNANIARAVVSLPHSEFLDQAHIKTVCTRVQFAAAACPKGSVYGHARAFTPLLDKPLEGPVYLRSSDNTLPDLVADLNGQIHIVLDGRIDSVKGGIRNTFSVVPDAPVTKFTLSMQGGSKGLLVNSENLCSPKAKTHAEVNLTAQNGKVYDTTPVVGNSCGGKSKKGKAHGGHRR